MIRFTYCSSCGNRLEDANDEVPIEILNFEDGNIYFFCCEDCLWEFVKEHTVGAYINPNGSIEQ